MEDHVAARFEASSLALDYVLENPHLVPDGLAEDEFAVIGGLLDDAVLDCVHEIHRRTLGGLGLVVFAGPHPQTGEDVVFELKVTPELVMSPLVIDRGTKLRDLLPMLAIDLKVTASEEGRPLHLSFPDRARAS